MVSDVGILPQTIVGNFVRVKRTVFTSEMWWSCKYNIRSHRKRKTQVKYINVVIKSSTCSTT